MPKPKKLDPYDIDSRVEKLASEWLEFLESEVARMRADGTEMTVPQVNQAFYYIGRSRIMQLALRKGDHEPDNAGSAVRKFSSAFQTHAANRRTPAAGSALAAALDDDPDEPAA